MATLTTKQRKALPSSKFALPGKRFPIPDASHARDALARVSQGVKAGTLSAADAAKVRTAANKMLGTPGKKKSSK
jgi:hypothetical protein